jgi:MurNAc alpha-1-phosphate uridylyltransferase
MLFAAGFGTRMGALTRDRPKPLIEVAGRPLIDHALALVAEAGVPRIVVNTHYLGAQLSAHLDGRGVRISDERPEILETGGGLKRALPLLAADPVFAMNTDAVWRGPNPLAALRAAWRPEMEALLLLVPKDRATGHEGPGDFLPDGGGRLQRGPGHVYTGAQILRTATVAGWPEDAFSLNPVWDGMAARGGLHGLVYDGAWCDVGRPEGVARAEAMLADA